jgi:hypothetical protein
MKKAESFPMLISIIFSELEKASHIRIDCTAACQTPTAPGGPAIRVTAVNGMSTPVKFRHRLEDLLQEAKDAFYDLLDQVGQVHERALMEMARVYLQQLDQTVVIPGSDGSAKWSSLPVCWSPGQVTCFLDGVESSDPMVIREAILQTRQQASDFATEICQSQEYVSKGQGRPLDPSTMLQGKDNEIPVIKEVLNMPLPLYCAMKQGLNNTRNFTDKEITELSHSIAGKYTTRAGEDFDPQVIAGLIKTPSPEAREELKKFIAGAVRNLNNSIRRERRRFQRAASYVRTVLSDPEGSARLTAQVRPGKTLYTLAMEDFTAKHPV